MEELFRFILARPAQAAPPDAPSVEVVLTPTYAKDLAAAADSRDVRTARRAVALRHMRSDASLRALDQLETAAPAARLERALEAKPQADLGEIEAIVAAAFGAAPADVVGASSYAASRARVGDEIATDVILGRPAPIPLEDLANHARILRLVAELADKNSAAGTKNGRRRLLSAPLVLPAELTAPASAPSPGPSDGQGATRVDRDPRRVPELRAERDRLLATYTLLTRIEPAHLDVDPVPTDEVVAQPETPRTAAGLPPPEMADRIALRSERPMADSGDVPRGSYSIGMQIPTH